MFIVDFDRIHVDNERNSELAGDFPLRPVNDLVRVFNVAVRWNLGMDRNHGAVGTVVVDDEIVRADNAVIGLDKFGNLRAELGSSAAADQRFDGVAGDAEAGVHDENGNRNARPAVDAESRENVLRRMTIIVTDVTITSFSNLQLQLSEPKN